MMQYNLKEIDTIRLISTLAAVLVGALALGAFALSYTSLQHLAQQSGLTEWMSYVWPLLLDFAMGVFSLAVLRANLRGESAIYPWILTGSYAGLAVFANVLDVTALGIPDVFVHAAVKALAPLSLVLAFELLMQMVKAELKRSNTITSIADMEADRQAQQTVLDQLAADQEHLTANIVDLEKKKAGLVSEIADLQKQKRKSKPPSIPDVSDDTRERARVILAERTDISGAELGRQLGRSESLGRKLKRELLSEMSDATGNMSGNGRMG